MLRPIDAYTLNNALVSWYNDTEGETEKSILRRVMQMVVHAPTLTPLNEPEYREYTCPYCYHTWLEDRDASDYPNYCPVCRAVLRDGSAPPNEALTNKGDENSER
nr:MAG TPA: cysteine-rich protein [Caudoviricetes sp.]